MKILIINGPNLNLLGIRDPSFYGSKTLNDVNAAVKARADALNIECEFYQSNHEGDIVDKIGGARDKYDGIVINGGAYSHYSYAIADAISSIGIAAIEVHLSNIYAREEHRRKSVLSPVCIGVIAGFKANSYILAVDALYERFMTGGGVV